jgi:dCMP deaminase
MKNSQFDWDYTFMRIALIIAEMSTCVKHKVGAVLVYKHRILATGYNGTPTGYKNCNEVFTDDSMEDPVTRKNHTEWAKLHEIHAETNAILDAGKRGVLVPDKMTLYITRYPCADCAKHIVTAGIAHVMTPSYVVRDPEIEQFFLDTGIMRHTIEWPSPC